MASEDVFELRAKIDNLDVESHKIVQKFPKSERHVLSADIRGTLSNIVRLEERAAKMQLAERRRRARPVQTLEYLQQLDAELGLLKRQINKAQNLDFLKAQGQTEHGRWTSMAIEVGKILGGWLKRVEAQAYPPRTMQQRPTQGMLE